MKKNDVIVAAGLGLAQLALFSVTAHAQDTARVLSDVVVTATKADQKQSQTGKVVTIITRQELERSSGKSVSQLLSEQAGIIVNGANGNPGLNKSIYLRGADTKHTLILLDGVLIFDPSGVGGAFDLRLLSVDQIDHIEILKGGQSTLYGSDAVAGVINIITKKDAGDKPGINGVLSAGSYGTVKGNLGLNARIGILSYNVNYSHERSDGVSEAAQPATATSFYDKDGYNQDAVNAQFNLNFTDRFKISPFVRFLQGKYSYDDGGYTDGGSYFTSKHLNIGTNATYKTDKGLFNFNYSYENTDRSYVDPVYGPSPYIGHLHFAELYYNHQFNEHIKILAGIDNRYATMNAAGTGRVDSSANLFGAYASVFFSHLLSVINVEYGERYTHSKYGSNWTHSATPSVDVVADGKLRVFGTVSTSFRAPDLNSLYGQFQANPNLKPETSHEYEAGASTALFDHFSLRAVAYQRKITNAIVPQPYPQPYINQDRQNAKGVELEPAATFGGFTVKGYYTYFKANSITQVAGKDQQMDYLYRRPANTIGLFAGLQATSKLYVSLNYRHYGQRYDLFYNSATFSNELQSLKGYSLVDGYAEYSLVGKKLKAFVDVKNILNAKYAELYGYTALGTNFNAGLSFNIH